MKISTTISIALATFSLAGCSSSARPPATEPTADPPTDDAPGALARADHLAGDWLVAGEPSRVTWLRPAPDTAIYGVAAVAVPVVWVIDDAPPDKALADRHLQLWRYQGDVVRACDETPNAPDGLSFACEDGTGGTKLWRNGEVLDVEEWTSSTGPDQVHLTPTTGQPAPELEEADRQFDREVAAGGITAWVSWFTDDAVQWWETEQFRGHEAIRAAMGPVLESTDLRWQPTVSRVLVDGALGVTAGVSTSTPRDGSPGRTGTYLTIWSKDPNGWRVLLDTGRTNR